jgi:hypothetical protein
MAQAYRPQSIDTKQAHVVVIHCSDPRYQPHFQDFLRLRLGLPHYGLIAIPGGVQMMSPSEGRETVREHGAAWIDFMATLMSADRCILLGHADCRWYLENGIAPDASCLKETQARDLLAVKQEIERRFPSIQTELYFAELKGHQANFTALQTDFPGMNILWTSGKTEGLASI